MRNCVAALLLDDCAVALMSIGFAPVPASLRHVRDRMLFQGVNGVAEQRRSGQQARHPGSADSLLPRYRPDLLNRQQDRFRLAKVECLRHDSARMRSGDEFQAANL